MKAGRVILLIGVGIIVVIVLTVSMWVMFSDREETFSPHRIATQQSEWHHIESARGDSRQKLFISKKGGVKIVWFRRATE